MNRNLVIGSMLAAVALVAGAPSVSADHVIVDTPVLYCEGDVEIVKPWEGGIAHLRQNLEASGFEGSCSNPQQDPFVGL